MGFNAIAPSDVPQIDDHFPEGRAEEEDVEGGGLIDSHSPKINVKKKAQYYEPPSEGRDAS